MLSGIDLLGEPVEEKSGVNLLSPDLETGKEIKPTSGLSLLKPIAEPGVEQPPVTLAPVSALAPEDIKSFYGTTAISPPVQGLLPMVWTPEIASYVGKQGFGPKPEGGWDELGNPLDANREPYYSHEKATGVVAETLQGLSSLASHPMEVVRGGLDFALSIPGFLTGLMSASSAMTKRTLDAVIMGTDTSLEDLYNIASEEMEKSAEFFDPGKRLLTGEPTPESELATQVVMAPMTGLSMVGHKVANYEGFKDSPNIRGAARFAGDIAGLATMGFLLHKGSRPKFTRKVEEVIKEADEIIVKEHAVQGIPNELIKQANQKVINAEKVQLDLKAKELVKEVAEEARIKGEEAKQAEGIIKAKSDPVEAKPVEFKTTEEAVAFGKEATPEQITELKRLREESEVKYEELTKEGKLDAAGEEAVNAQLYREALEVKEVKAKVKTELVKAKPKVKTAYSEFLDSLGKKFKSEFKGQEILDILEESKISPTKVSETFWKDTFNKIPKESQGKIKSYLYNLTGIKPGDPIASLKGKTIEAKNWQEIADMLGNDFTKIEHLEGPERGYVSLMAYANEKFVGAKAKPKPPKLEELPEFPEAKIIPEELKVEPRPTTEVDRMTGVELPELKGETSPFFQNKETTEVFNKIYKDRAKSVETDVELMTQKLINDVNKWYHGDEAIPIGKTREMLSEIATRANELRMEFITGQDHLLWKETVREAADWSKNLDRLKIERRPEHPWELTKSEFDRPEMPTSSKDPLPIVSPTYYHGTDAFFNVSEFKNKSKSINTTTLGDVDTIRHGIFITDSKKFATEYGKNILPVKTKTKKMADVEIEKHIFIESLDAIGADRDIWLLASHTKENWGMFEGKLGERFVNFLKQKRYDSAYFEDVLTRDTAKGIKEVSGETVVVFDAKDILTGDHKQIVKQALADGKTVPKEVLSEYPDLISADSIDRLKIERTEGVELYAGLSPKEVTKVMKSMVKGTSNFMTGFKKSAKTKEFDFEYAIKQIKSDTIRALADQSETLLNIVRKKYPEDYNKIVTRQRSAITGKGWGRVLYEQAEREIFRGKSKEMLDATNAYILARRFKDIYSYRTEKGYKHQPGFGPEDVISLTSMVEMFKDTSNKQFKSLKAKFPKIDEMFGKLTADQFKEVVKASDTYFEWSRKMVDDLVEAGLKTVEEGELLKAHDFRKFKTIRVEKLYDFDYSVKLKGETMKSTNSGVQSLGLGSTKMIEPDARTVLSEQFSRVYGSISNQAAKLEWKALAEKHPESGFVSVKQVKGWSPMPYMDKGVRKNIYFHPDAAKYLVTRSKDMSPRLASVLRGLFLAPVTRALAVGASPMWSTFIGIPMDMMHSLWAARTWEADAKGIKPKASFPFYETTQGKFKKVYSSFPAVDKLQLGTDMARTFRDVYKRGPFTKNLMKHGLVMNFLTQRMGRYMKGTKPPGDWARMMDLLSYHGMSMELWVRAATADRIIRRESKKKGITYEQGLKDKDIMYKSVHSARDRMDYNQGGWLVKALDSAGMIFLNAGVLGTRTFWRQTTSNPVDFTVRTGRIMATAAGLTATAWMLYPEIMKDVPIKGNEKNAVWPLAPEWLKAKDIDGNDITFHLKLRMDPGGAFMYRVAENLTKTYMYDQGLIKEEPDYHELVDSLKKIGPVNISLPPTAQLGIDYVTNYSWWKDRQMYTELGGKTLPWGESKHEGEFDRNVSQLAKDVGRATGASPKRLQGAGSNVIPYNNEFAWAMGKAYEQAFSDVPEEARKQHWLITLAESPGFNRVVGITRHGQGRWKIKADISDEITLERLVRNNKFDMLATDYAWYGARDKKEVIDFIKEQKDIDVIDNMMDKLEFVSDPLIKTLPHRRFWLSMKHMSVEGRARTWTELVNRVTDVEKDQLRKELAQVAELEGIVTDEFFDEIEKIQMGE